MTAGMNPRPGNTQVFDPLLRLLHWGLALCVVLLIATSQLAEVFEHGVAEDTMWSLHILSGYGLALTLLARVLWGLVGPASARWRDLWHPAVWHHALLDRRRPRTHRIGHDALASLAYLLAYGIMVLMILTGLVLAASEFNAGPLAGWPADMTTLADWLEDPHEFGFGLMLGYVGLHLAALVFHQSCGERVAQSMISGRQYPRTPHD